MNRTRPPTFKTTLKTSSLALLLVLFSQSVLASGVSQHKRSMRPAPAANANAVKAIVHAKSGTPDFRPRPPVGARLPERYLDYDHSPQTSSARFIVDNSTQAKHFAQLDTRSHTAAVAAAVASCDTNAFASASSSTMGELVRTSTLDCLNTLFSVSGSTGASVFSASKMSAVANYAAAYAASYPGDDTTGVQQFALYLRAGYYVQYYNSSSIPTYPSSVTSGVTAYLDAFFASSHSYDVNDAHGAVLNEVITLTASSNQEARYASRYKALLNDYNSSYNAYYNMQAAMDSVLTAYFQGAWQPDWVSTVNSDTSMVTTLYDFVTHSSFNANTSNEWLTRDAAGELAHFLDNTVYAANVVSTAKPLVAGVISSYNYTNNGPSIFIAAVSGQDYYDSANCSYYGTCNTKADVKAYVQGQTYQCPGDAIKIVSQGMTAQQFSDSCATLHNEVAYIHGLMQDSGAVAGDNTIGLEIDEFNSSADYATYAGYLYGISTNNGGLSMEGDPSQPGNVAHFYCYHADWITADWEIWNLWHEFTHYMDAKYDLAGDFSAAPTSNADLPYSTVWWIEGFAEYVSYSYRNLVDSGAVSTATNHSYTLPTLFDNTYDMSNYEDRTYPGGYLAVNFMINNHRADIDTMLGIFRAGAYGTSYHTFMDGIRNSYSSEFEAFETCFANNGGTGGCGGGGGGGGPTASLSSGSLTFGSTNVGSTSAAQNVSLINNGPGTLSVSSVSISGDYLQTNNCNSALPSGSSCTVSVTFKPTASGTRTGSLTVSDNATNGPQTASLTGTGASSSGSVLTNGVGVAISDASANHPQNWTMVVPAGATNLVFSISGGTGDADLYVKFGSAATTSSYDCRPYIGGNNETCTIANVQAGTYSVMVNGYSAYSGVTLKGSYAGGGTGGGGNISFAGTVATQGGYAYTPQFTSGAGNATATLSVPSGTQWRFDVIDNSANQVLKEKSGSGPLNLTFTATAGHSYSFFVESTLGSGAWSITGSHP